MSNRRRPTRSIAHVQADYRQTPFGRWVGVVTASGWGSREVSGSTPAEVVDAAMQIVEEVADDLDVPCATLHTLDGDAEAWARIAIAHGLMADPRHG